jgi:hypothetical protein
MSTAIDKTARSIAGACDGCGKSFYDVPMAPMLCDTVWRKLAEKRETLCAICMFKRAHAADLDLTIADLRPCAFNLFACRISWFDMFMLKEKEPPANTSEWDQRREAARRSDEWRRERWSALTKLRKRRHKRPALTS